MRVAGGGLSAAAGDRLPPDRTRLWLTSACAGRRRPGGLGLCREMGQWSMWPQGCVAAWGGLQGTGPAVCPRLVFSGF